MTANEHEEDRTESPIRNTSGPNYGNIVQTGSFAGDVHFHNHVNAWADVPAPPEIVPPYHMERFKALSQALDDISPGQVWTVSGFAAWALVLLWVHDNKKRIPSPLFLDVGSRTARYVAEAVQAQQPTHIIFENVSEVSQVEPLLRYTEGRRVIITSEKALSSLESSHNVHSYRVPDNETSVRFPLAPTEAQYEGDIRESAFAVGFISAVIAVIVALANQFVTWSTVLVGVGGFLLLFLGTWTIRIVQRAISPPIGGYLTIGREGIRVQRAGEEKDTPIPWESIAYVGVAGLKLHSRFYETPEPSTNITGEAEPPRQWVLFYKDIASGTIERNLDSFLTDEARQASLYGLCVIHEGIPYSNPLVANADLTEVANALEHYAPCIRLYRVPEIREHNPHISNEAL